MINAKRVFAGVAIGVPLLGTAIAALIWPTELALNLVGGVLIVLQVAALAIVLNGRARGRVAAGSFLLVSGVLAFWDYWAPEPEDFFSPPSERLPLRPFSAGWEMLLNWLTNRRGPIDEATGPAAYLAMHWDGYYFIEVGVLLMAIATGAFAAYLVPVLVHRVRSPTPSESPPRPRFQLELRTLLLYTLVISLALGYAMRERRIHEAIQPAFQRLDQDFIWASGGHPRYFPWFNRLVWLDVPGHIDFVWLAENATEEDFLAVCQLPIVREVKVSHWRASEAPAALVDRWPRHLRQVRGLRKVELQNLPLRALRAFEGLPLEEVVLEDMGEMSDNELGRLAEFEQLKSLSVIVNFPDYDADPMESWLKCLQHLPHLESLTLTGIAETNESAKLIGTATGLKHLRLSDADIDDDGAAALSRLTQLQTLELPLEVGDQGIAHLHSLQSLTTLVAHGELTDQSCAWIGENRQLRKLELGKAQITDRGLEALMTLKSLEQLNLRSSNLTDEGLKKLATLTQLQYLNVSGQGITDRGLQHLHVLPRLRTLSLRRTSVTQSGIEAADRFRQLDQLYLGDAAMDGAAIQRFNARMKARGRRLELCIGWLN